MIGNDFVNTAHHLGSQQETQISIYLIAFMWRCFVLQEEQLDIYSRPMVQEAARGVGEDDAIPHLTYYSILQGPQVKKGLFYSQADRPRMKGAMES